MSEHNLILEFYKPTYNLDFDYDGDGGLDLHFTNIKGEFFMTMNDSYNSVYIEDEDCEFSKGEMFATVDLGDLVERIINGEFRQTNGKAVSDWGKRFIGDGEEQIEFNGKNYADGSLFWDDFFKEMSKDEIKDFMTFCEDYLDLPNIEVDTVSNKYDFENGKVELKSNGKWSITVNDDYTIILVDKFTCNSTDACDAYYVASSESDEDDYYESKKSTRKSLKESSKILAKNKKGKVVGYIEPQKDGSFGYAFGSPSQKEVIMFYVDTLEQAKDRIAEHSYDDVIFESKKSARKNLKEGISAFNKAIAKKYNETEPNSVGQYYLDWRFDLQDEKDNIEAIADRCGVTVEFQSDEGYFEVFEESKKSARKSLKEYLVKGLDVDFVVDHLLSLEDPNNFDLINELDDLWKLYKKSWSKFNKSLSDFWKVMKDIEKLDSFDDNCKEIIDAWYDDIEKIFYSDDNLENLKLNFGFEGNDVFESLEEDI